MEARRDRSKSFGITELTPKEKMLRIIHERPDLKYVGTRVYENGFESATGLRRGKRAIVVGSPDGADLLLTNSEASVLRESGVDIPFTTADRSPDPLKRLFR